MAGGVRIVLFICFLRVLLQCKCKSHLGFEVGSTSIFLTVITIILIAPQMFVNEFWWRLQWWRRRKKKKCTAVSAVFFFFFLPFPLSPSLVCQSREATANYRDGRRKTAAVALDILLLPLKHQLVSLFGSWPSVSSRSAILSSSRSPTLFLTHLSSLAKFDTRPEIWRELNTLLIVCRRSHCIIRESPRPADLASNWIKGIIFVKTMKLIERWK